MKKSATRALCMTLTTAALCGIAFTSSAADGSINFTGTILDSACTIDTGNANQTVNLGMVPKSTFSKAGDMAAATRFSIVLENCPDTVTSASIKFDGKADATNTSILALSDGQTAKGVGIALYEEDGITAIPLATRSKSITLDTATPANSNSLTYVAKYMATQASVEAGSANSTSDFTITYQ